MASVSGSIKALFTPHKVNTRLLHRPSSPSLLISRSFLYLFILLGPVSSLSFPLCLHHLSRSEFFPPSFLLPPFFLPTFISISQWLVSIYCPFLSRSSFVINTRSCRSAGVAFGSFASAARAFPSMRAPTCGK